MWNGPSLVARLGEESWGEEISLCFTFILKVIWPGLVSEGRWGGRETGEAAGYASLFAPLSTLIIDSFIFRVLQEVILEPRVASKLLNPWVGSSVTCPLPPLSPPGGTISQVLVPPLIH